MDAQSRREDSAGSSDTCSLVLDSVFISNPDELCKGIITRVVLPEFGAQETTQRAPSEPRGVTVGTCYLFACILPLPKLNGGKPCAAI